MNRVKIELPELEKIKTYREKITEEDMRNVEHLREEGYRWDSIDKAYGRKHGTIAKLYYKYQKGEDILTLQHNYAFDYGKLRALLNAGWSCKQIAMEFSTSIETIEGRIKEMIALAESNA